MVFGEMESIKKWNYKKAQALFNGQKVFFNVETVHVRTIGGACLGRTTLKWGEERILYRLGFGALKSLLFYVLEK